MGEEGAAVLAGATRPDLVFPRLSARDAGTVLDEIAAGVAAAVPQISGPALRRGFAEREALGSTALGGGLAVPHCKATGLDRAYLAVGLCPTGIEFGAADGQPTRIFFAVVSPDQTPAAHLKLLAAISRWAREPARLARLLAAGDREAVLSALEDGEG